MLNMSQSDVSKSAWFINLTDNFRNCHQDLWFKTMWISRNSSMLSTLETKRKRTYVKSKGTSEQIFIVWKYAHLFVTQIAWIQTAVNSKCPRTLYCLVLWAWLIRCSFCDLRNEQVQDGKKVKSRVKNFSSVMREYEFV